VLDALADDVDAALERPVGQAVAGQEDLPERGLDRGTSRQPSTRRPSLTAIFSTEPAASSARTSSAGRKAIPVA
jgi:hypothetical protein